MAAKPESKAAKQQDSKPPGNAAPGGPKVVTVGNLRELGGSRSDNLNNVLANQALNTVWVHRGADEETRKKQVSAVVAALVEFKPTDGIEGMMAAQAIGLHSAAMECLRRAMLPEQSGEASDQLRRQSANLSRAFLDVVAALDRKRGKGVRQVVRVERVMVAPGGQAIVGNVQAGGDGVAQHGEGVGHDGETGGEPHAKPNGQTTPGTTPAALAHDAAPGAVLPPLRSADPGRDALPVPSDAKRSLPNARGCQHGA